MSTHICRQCGHEFYRKGRGPAKFCGHRCRGLSRVGKPCLRTIGEGNSLGMGYFRPDLQMYFRSRWEANYARYLNKFNREFVYEPEKRGFLIGLPDGSQHYYRPDFLVDHSYYVEIKGWERADRHQTEVIKAAQFQLPLPLYIIRASQYRQLERKIAHKITNWEYSGDDKPPRVTRYCSVCGNRIISIHRRTKFCSIKCYAASRTKESMQSFIEGGKKTRFKRGHNLGSIGGIASREARQRRGDVHAISTP